MKLSRRLETIAQLVQADRQVVYDLCCDHAKLAKVLSQTYPKVVALDIVPQIIERVKATHIPNIEFICSDATTYQYSGIKACFIMTGIGGELACRIIENIFSQNLSDIQFIVAVNGHLPKVKEKLKPLKLENEILIKEKNQFYEVWTLVDGKEEGLKFGDKLWNDPTADHLEYLDEQLGYYRIKAKFDERFRSELVYYERVAKTLKKS